MTQRRLTAAAIALMLATPVAVWWVVGDLEEKGADERDRISRPFELPSVVENVAGVAAVLTVLLIAAAMNADEPGPRERP